MTWTARSASRAAELWRKGLSATEIAAEMEPLGYAYTPEQIRKFASRNRRTMPLKTPEQTRAAIARGMARVPLSSYERVKRSPDLAPWVHEAARMWAEGLKALEIARRQGKTPGTLNYAIRANRGLFPKRYR